MEKLSIEAIQGSLGPDKVAKLNSLGVDTSGSQLYWKTFNIAGREYFELGIKELFPYTLGKGEYDAPSYLELKCLLPSKLTDKDGRIYRLHEITEDHQNALAYLEVCTNEILHEEDAYYHCDMVYKMLIWYLTEYKS